MILSNLVSLQASLVGSTGCVVVGVAVVATSVVISSGKKSVVVSMGGSGEGPGAVLLPNFKKRKEKLLIT